MSDHLYPSAELRWFLPGHEPWDDLLQWFSRQGPFLLEGVETNAPIPSAELFVKREQERTDEYLLLPGCDTVGIKQRQGRLEVKSLVAGPRPIAYGAVVGRADQWLKWAFDPSNALADPLGLELAQSGSWRRVVKRRCLQKISLDSSQPVVVEPDLFPAAGCTIELTALDVEAEVDAWVTFGFEAFGTPGRVMACLDAAVQHFFHTHGPPPVRLEGRDSLSYPAWIALLR